MRVVVAFERHMRTAHRIAAADAEVESRRRPQSPARPPASSWHDPVAERLKRTGIEAASRPRNRSRSPRRGRKHVPAPLDVTVAAHDPRKRRRAHDGFGAARRPRARNRGRPDRRRRGHARDAHCRAPRSSISRALRAARIHRLARPLPDVVARPAGRAARGGIGRSRRRSSASARTLAAARGSAGPGGDRPSGTTQPTKEALDEVTGSTPAALWAKDYHSLWLNSAALALARGDLEVDGGVVERDEQGEPTGMLREESAWQFRERFGAVSEDEWVDATRAGMRIAASSRRRRSARQGRLARRGRGSSSASRSSEGLTLRVWQSVPYERLPELEALGVRSGIGDTFLRIGYLKVFMDGTLGSQTAWMLDGSGVQITSGEELEEIDPRAARAGWPVGVHAIGDRANREALDAFEATRDDVGAAGPAAAHRARAVPRTRGRRPVRRHRSRMLRPVQPCALGPRPRGPLLGRAREGSYAFRSLWDSGALVANGSDAPVEELDPLAGIRAGVLRTIDDRPAWHPEQMLTIGAGAPRGHGQPGLARPATSAAREAAARLSRGSRRPEPRPARVPGGRARDRRGGRDDGRRPLGPQPAALGLTMPADRSRGRASTVRPGSSGIRLRPAGACGARLRGAGGAMRPRAGRRACSRSGPGRVRRRGECSGSARTRSSPSNPIPRSPRYLETSLGDRVDVRIATLEDAQLPTDTFALAVAASSFHWVDEEIGLAKSSRRSNREGGSRCGGRSSGTAEGPTLS